jgi:hypothetical protein
MKRSPLPPHRTPLRRKSAVRKRRATPRDRGDYAEPLYLAWLRLQPCRVPGCHRDAEAHHLRHGQNGASLGARIKDDRRAISLCGMHHRERLHDAPWMLRLELAVDDLKAWQDQQLEIQRGEWERLQPIH